MNSRRRAFVRFGAAVIIALVALYVVERSPRFSYFRAVDILLLFFSGVAFGAAVVELLVSLRKRAEN